MTAGVAEVILDSHSTLHPKIAVIRVDMFERINDTEFVTTLGGPFAMLRFVFLCPLYRWKRGGDFCPSVTAPARFNEMNQMRRLALAMKKSGEAQHSRNVFCVLV